MSSCAGMRGCGSSAAAAFVLWRPVAGVCGDGTAAAPAVNVTGALRRRAGVGFPDGDAAAADVSVRRRRSSGWTGTDGGDAESLESRTMGRSSSEAGPGFDSMSPQSVRGGAITAQTAGNK